MLYIFKAMLYNIGNAIFQPPKGKDMHSLNHERSGRIFAALCTLMLVIVLYAAMCVCSGVHPSSYQYPSYLLQAQAWLRGEIALDMNYEYLELAVYEGRYYVSFPPVPAVPMVLWTLIWGDRVPGGLFQKIYIAIACLIVLSEIKRSKRLPMGECIAWAFLICFASAMLPITLVGGVWYEAQILAFLFCVGAIAAIRRGRCTLACLLYALSVGCRPFCVLLGPVLLMMYIGSCRRDCVPFRRAFAKILPGLIAGLGVAAAYGAYNYARFGNIFEFGHNHLPEFTRSEYGQMNLRYVLKNWKTLFFGSPFATENGRTGFREFGFSMFLSCPVFICNLVWLAKDIRNRRLSPVKIVIVLMGAANVFLLLMHRTLGGHQFGARYALELVPLTLCYLLESPDRRKITRWESALLGFGLVFNFIGGCFVHI